MQAVFRGLVTAKPLFCCSEGGVLRIGGVGGPPRTGPGCISTAGSKAGSEVWYAPCNSPPWGWWWLAALSPWELRRFDACGRGMVEDYTAAGRMPSCIKYIVFICAFCAKSPLVRMRSPVQIWVAAPKCIFGRRGFLNSYEFEKPRFSAFWGMF